ncbi:hypothetical protein ACJX0J_026078, partial [Zea mays]
CASFTFLQVHIVVLGDILDLALDLLFLLFDKVWNVEAQYPITRERIATLLRICIGKMVGEKEKDADNAKQSAKTAATKHEFLQHLYETITIQINFIWYLQKLLASQAL